MLTIEERDIVVAAMRKYPAGVDQESWGKSEDFFYDVDYHDDDGPKEDEEVEELTDAILLEHG